MRLSNEIKKLIVTEKSNDLKNNNIYVFKVDENLTKYAIAKHVSTMFGVDVLKVRTAIMPNKDKKTTKSRRPVRVGRFKKAYVEVKEGQVIDINKENK